MDPDHRLHRHRGRGGAVAWQVVLPQVSTKLQFIGGAANAGTYSTPDGAKNALILGAILIIFATIINMLGVRIMARINNFGVIVELIGATLLVILLIFHFQRGPAVVTHTLGTGAGHSWGYFGAFLIGGIMSAYVMYGFDTAGTLAEETNDPRRAAPPAILRALGAAGLIGALLILFSLMSVDNIHDKNIGLLGLPYIIKQALGNTLGNIFLIASAIAITVAMLPGGVHGMRSGCCSAWRVTAGCRSAPRWRGCPGALASRSSRRCSSASARSSSWRSTSPIESCVPDADLVVAIINCSTCHGVSGGHRGEC